MIENILKNFGLNDKETKIYLTILKLGSASVRKIGETSGINRTTTYDILKKLIDEGLVSFVDKEKHKYFTAESPEHLLLAINNKKNKLNQVKDKIEKALPELKSIYQKSETKPRAKYFEGESGLKTTLQDVLNNVSNLSKEKVYYVYSSSAIREKLHKCFPDYNKERLKLGIKVKSISIGSGGELHGLDDRKWLSKNEGAPTYTMIYAHKVALISLDENNNPICVVIEDRNTYKTQVMIFKQLWEKI